MASYIIKSEVNIQRQEGDTGDVEFTIPSILDPDNYTITFTVFEPDGDVIFSIDTWTVDGQDITGAIVQTDTKGYAGSYRWELVFESETEEITVGKGNFIIIPEYTV